jgi:hypothetical protein
MMDHATVMRSLSEIFQRNPGATFTLKLNDNGTPFFARRETDCTNELLKEARHLENANPKIKKF